LNVDASASREKGLERAHAIYGRAEPIEFRSPTELPDRA
jgi:hypothetical protein